MILNSTSGVLFNIEQEMKNLCLAGKGRSTVVAFYDFYQLPPELYIGLKLKEAKNLDVDTRRELPDGSNYYKMVSADLKGFVN